MTDSQRAGRPECSTFCKAASKDDLRSEHNLLCPVRSSLTARERALVEKAISEATIWTPDEEATMQPCSCGDPTRPHINHRKRIPCWMYIGRDRHDIGEDGRAIGI